MSPRCLVVSEQLEAVGGLVRGSKGLATWKFAFEDDPAVIHSVEFRHSMTEYELRYNGQVVSFGLCLFTNNFERTFETPSGGGHKLKLRILDTFEGYRYSLLCDDIEFYGLELLEAFLARRDSAGEPPPPPHPAAGGCLEPVSSSMHWDAEKPQLIGNVLLRVSSKKLTRKWKSVHFCLDCTQLALYNCQKDWADEKEPRKVISMHGGMLVTEAVKKKTFSLIDDGRPIYFSVLKDKDGVIVAKFAYEYLHLISTFASALRGVIGLFQTEASH